MRRLYFLPKEQTISPKNMTMDPEKIDWSKFSNEALEFAFKESSVVLNATLTTFKDTTTRSYFALTFYASILVFYYQQQMVPDTLIPFLGCICSVLVIWPSLMPGRMSFSGTEPHDLIHPYYESITHEAQLREMYISKLVAHENAIHANRKENNKRLYLFRLSAIVLVLSFLLAFLFRFWRLIESLPIRI